MILFIISELCERKKGEKETDRQRERERERWREKRYILSKKPKSDQ